MVPKVSIGNIQDTQMGRARNLKENKVSILSRLHKVIYIYTVKIFKKERDRPSTFPEQTKPSDINKA